MSRKKSNNAWKKKVKQEQNYRCPLCGQKGTDKTLNIHHKRPKSRGGTNARDNVVAWHKSGHQRYHEKHGNSISDDYGNPLD